MSSIGQSAIISASESVIDARNISMGLPADCTVFLLYGITTARTIAAAAAMPVRE